MQAHLSAHAGECLGQEVCRSHPRFELAEGVFDGLPTVARPAACGPGAFASPRERARSPNGRFADIRRWCTAL